MMGEFPFVRALGVRRDVRGKGIGTELLAFAEERMFRLKPLLFMLVSDFNEGAQRLYRRLGYERVGAIPDYKKPGIGEYILMKRNI
jgi:ribosomal protein S18 acetylase RimI-like enzyme